MDETAGSVSTPDVSVILPAMNEEQTIGTCISKIQKVFAEKGIHGEIIVSDASTDRTPDIARSMGAIVIHPKKRGYGEAYREAFDYATGRIIILGDADDTYDFLELPVFFSALERGADFVVGSRFKGEIRRNAMPWLHRYVGNPVLTFILNLIFKTRFSDTHSGFRAITREALDRLQFNATGMEFASEMLIMAAKRGMRIEEVPISYSPRIAPSKLHSFADGWRHLRYILLLKPIPFLAMPGAVISALGISLMALFYTFGEIETSHLHSFILSAILFSGGMQAILMGLTIKVYSVIHGYEDRRGFIDTIMDYRSLEWIIVLGGFTIFCGFLIGIKIIIDWMAAGFGRMSQISNAVVSLSFIFVGLELALSAIFISMMLLNDPGSK
ncbi:MAG: glycosyltransferase family 2 protein [Methanoregulaceae archaeon]|nr:glycosyltransferase family 2 protein [Methanoregulaceae archaeon]